MNIPLIPQSIREGLGEAFNTIKDKIGQAHSETEGPASSGVVSDFVDPNFNTCEDRTAGRQGSHKQDQYTPGDPRSSLKQVTK